jgi:hypothetical protein
MEEARKHMNAEVIAPLIATVMFGVFVLTGMKMFLGYRIKRLQAQKEGRPPELDEAIADLRDQMHLLRGEVVDLQERMDFHERVLTRGQAGERAGEM